MRKNAQKRIFRMRFTFKNKKYDKNKQYYLVVYDEKAVWSSGGSLSSWTLPLQMTLDSDSDIEEAGIPYGKMMDYGGKMIPVKNCAGSCAATLTVGSSAKT